MDRVSSPFVPVRRPAAETGRHAIMNASNRPNAQAAARRFADR